MACGLPVAFVVLVIGAAWMAVPMPYPDRLAHIAWNDTSIDNEIAYNDESDWDRGGTHFGLYLLNSGRVPFFLDSIAARFDGPVHLLDAGCGGGIVTHELARAGHTTTGVDLQDAALRFARHRAFNESVGGHETYVKGSLYELPFSDNQFDVIVCSDVFEHLNDLRQTAREMFRVLKPVPSYFLMIKMFQDWLRLVPADVHDWKLFITPHEMNVVLEEAGFHVDAASLQSLIPDLKFIGNMLGVALHLVDAAEATGSFSVDPLLPIVGAYVGNAVKPVD